MSEAPRGEFWSGVELQFEEDLVKDWQQVEKITTARLNSLYDSESSEPDLIAAWREAQDMVRRFRLYIDYCIQAAADLKSIQPLLDHDLRNIEDWIAESPSIENANQMVKYLANRMGFLRDRLTERENEELELRLTAYLRDTDT